MYRRHLAASVLVAGLLLAGAGVPGSRFTSGGSAPASSDADFGSGGPFMEAALEEKAPEDSYLFRHLADGAPSPEAFRAAARRSRAIGRLTRRVAPTTASKRWGFVGPRNIGGRVVDIAVDPELKDTIYVAAASGGVWKSTDAGQSYKPIWRKSRVQSMGALVMGADGTLWAGTGETNPGGGSLTYGGNGLYKSTDRGKTWQNVGLRNSYRIGRIAVDPKDPDHVFVAVSGNLFVEGGERGLYETTDAGETWKLILEGDTSTTGATDVAIDPKDPKNILVAMWDHIRHPDVRYYSGAGSGVYRSTDGGKTFTRLGPTNGLPPSSDDVGRIGVTFDPQDPSRAYAIYANNKVGAYYGWFISNDGGQTWFSPPTSAGLASSQSVYGWWFARVWVDPAESDHVFVAGLPLAESTDGGMTFPTLQLEQHVDHHAMAWDPHKKGVVYNGNDGGVYRSTENGADGSWKHGPYQPWVQFYQIDVSEQDPARVNGGLQDQGSVRSWQGEETSKDWNNYNGGDGVENVINPKEKDNVFACSQYGACNRSDNGGNTMQGMEQESIRFGWLTPIEFLPGSDKIVFWAGDSVHRSEDRGQSWERISEDLGEGDAGREVNPLYAAHYGTVQAFGLNKKKPETMYAGTDNGLLWKTTDLASWTKIENEALPQRWITAIEVPVGNPDVLYVSYSGYREGDNAAYVLVSKDGGKTFKDISKTLPKAPVNDLALVGRKLFAATDVGVFSTSVRSIRWLKLGRGLPLCPINDLRWIAKNGSLYAGTFGRGIYKLRLR